MIHGPRLRRAPRRSRRLARVDPVVPTTSVENVAPALPYKAIAAATAEQLVRRPVPDQDVVAAAAADVLHVAVDVVVLSGDAVVRALADRHSHGLAALAVERDVAVRSPGHVVGPEAAAEAVIAATAAQIVGSGAAECLVIARTTV